MRTFGIDLSANPAKTGACEIDWEAGTMQLLARPTGDAELVAAAMGADMTAIDVPLGWPEGFIDALVAHRDGHGWPPAETAPPEDRLPLRSPDHRPRRAQDRSPAAQRVQRPDRCRCHARSPPPASPDRRRRPRRPFRAERPGDRGLPGRSAPHVGTDYKGAANSAACEDLAAALASLCGSLAQAAAECLHGCDDDGLDAVVCALVAKARLDGNTTGPGPEDLPSAEREGWIQLPTVGLREIVGASPAPPALP